MKLICTIFIIVTCMISTSAQVFNSSDTNTTTFDFKYLVREPINKKENPPVLFLFHGAGSNEYDLFSFASQIPDEWLVISARAPYVISEGHYKWYDVKMIDKKITLNFEQEEKSRQQVLKFIDKIISFYNADSNRVVLAGFSQGANMSLVVSLTVPEKVNGFAIFSGRFIEEIKPLISKSASLKSLHCFLSHGNQDYMLPIAYARENQQMLQGLGIPVIFSEDAVAHSISSKQFEEFLDWLKQF